MKNRSFNIAKEIHQRINKPIEPMKLIDLVMYAQGWHIALTKDYFFDDKIVKVSDGITSIPKLRHLLKGNPIVHPEFWDFVCSPELTDAQQFIIDSVVKNMVKYEAIKLKIKIETYFNDLSLNETASYTLLKNNFQRDLDKDKSYFKKYGVN